MTGYGGDGRIDVHDGMDTDHDGYADTLLVPGGRELVLVVDSDRDGFADLVIEIGPDAVAHSGPLLAGATDPLADACYGAPDLAAADAEVAAVAPDDPSRW